MVSFRHTMLVGVLCILLLLQLAEGAYMNTLHTVMVKILFVRNTLGKPVHRFARWINCIVMLKWVFLAWAELLGRGKQLVLFITTDATLSVDPGKQTTSLEGRLTYSVGITAAGWDVTAAGSLDRHQQKEPQQQHKHKAASRDKHEQKGLEREKKVEKKNFISTFLLGLTL